MLLQAPNILYCGQRYLWFLVMTFGMIASASASAQFVNSQQLANNSNALDGVYSGLQIQLASQFQQPDRGGGIHTYDGNNQCPLPARPDGTSPSPRLTVTNGQAEL